uniref:L-lactate dehydrogenase n=1 Tax=Lygus hesperus TaxID=30085 RepID=A0A0A9WUX3_LYGHE
MSMSIKPRVVGIIGCGQVGAHVAFVLAVRGEADVILFSDVNVERAKAQAMDLEDAVTYLPHRVICRTCSTEDLGICDVIVLAAGTPPAGNQSRLDTLPNTMRVVKSVIDSLNKGTMKTFKGIFLCI